ncbi:MAG: class I SAM-dependent methyltransferase [Candidatus Bathyarchaeota archaeon]|nr:class I SAM-dependent methyltransferase [Candidatus Bathyarchaeota archaeon]
MTEAIKAFNQVAHTYDDWYQHPQGRQVFEAELNAVNSLIPETGLGLEIGAGTGIFAEKLSKKDRKIVCLDPSKAMLIKARMRHQVAILGVGDWLPIRRKTLAFTYIVTVIEFLKDPVQVFFQVKESGKENATLTILFINSESRWGELYRDIGSKGDPVFQHARLYTLNEVRKLLETSGFIVTDSVGTLTSGPMEMEVDRTLRKPSVENGVIIVKSKPQKLKSFHKSS